MKFLTFILLLAVKNIYASEQEQEQAKTLIQSERLFEITYRQKFYYSSYYYIKKLIAEPTARIDQSKVSDLINIIHPSLFIYDQQLDQFISNKTALDFPVGLRLFFLNKTDLAEQKMKSITSKDKMFIESNYILGLINLKRKKEKEAYSYFKRCMEEAKTKQATPFKPESYIEIFKGRCIQQMSRLLFSSKNYKNSIKVQETAQKTDYIWPHLLLDKAWSYYWNNEKPRALGTIMTYDAPILQKFITPEAIYLKALIYYDFCQYEKVQNIYKDFTELLKFHKQMAPLSPEQMISLINTENKDRINNKEKNLFYTHLKSLKKDIRYFNYTNSKKLINAEIKKIEHFKTAKTSPKYIEELKSYENIIEQDFKDFLSQLRNDYLLQIEAVQRHFVKMNLSINSKKRLLLASNNKNSDQKGAFLKLSDIPYSPNKNIWDFRGGFWADEFGDYAIALENKCQK